MIADFNTDCWLREEHTPRTDGTLWYLGIFLHYESEAKFLLKPLFLCRLLWLWLSLSHSHTQAGHLIITGLKVLLANLTAQMMDKVYKQCKWRMKRENKSFAHRCRKVLRHLYIFSKCFTWSGPVDLGSVSETLGALTDLLKIFLL